MSTKTNNSDMSSSNDDGMLYKFDDLRSLTSFNSSEISRDTKNHDSGIGTSTASSCLNRRDKIGNFVVNKVELLDELKSLLNLSPPKNLNSQKNTQVELLQFENTESVTDSGKDNTFSESNTNTSSNINPSNEEYNVDLLMLQAIQYIKKLKKHQKKNPDSNSKITPSQRTPREPCSPGFSTEDSSTKEVFANFCYNNEDMCISILVKTGLIVYVDERLTNLLGQNAKAWIGRRPIDYLYQDDINLLLTKLCELTTKINTGSNISVIEIDPFFLRFKKDKILNHAIENEINNKQINSDSQSSFTVQNPNELVPRLTYIHDSIEYIAFRVELKADKVELKISDYDEKSKANENQNTQQSKNHIEQFNPETCILFKLSFPTIAYFQDIDNYTERSFITEHDINLHINRVENTVTELLGYLPQELERKSIIKFIHPDDLVKIKQIHFDIFDGKERQNQEIYRWRCHNGCFVSVRTNWSWFIHPWKKQIDFIIGKHVVLVDPMNKNIFEDKKLDLNNKSMNQTKCASVSQPKSRTDTSLTSVNIISNKSCGTNSDESNNDKKTFNISSNRDDTDSSFSNKIEKDIVEYISKKIPGMDDATQMLGQDVIRFIKKKNISASYCQEQSRIMKKSSKNIKKYRPPKSFKYAYEYPQYYQSRPRLEKSAVKRLANFHSYYEKKHSQNFRSSSSSNSGYPKWRAQYTSRKPRKVETEVGRQKQKDSMHQNEVDLTEESKNNQTSSNESDQKDSKICSVSESSQPNRQTSENNRLPSLFEDIFSKKSFQPNLLKDHTLFTQYMICKYIDDLPNSWNQEDETTAMATGENTVQDSSEPKCGLKRSLDDNDCQNDLSTSNFELSNSKMRKQSSTHNSEIAVTSVCAKNNDFVQDKTMFDFFLNKNETSNLNPNDEQVIFKKANSYSSRSHSRIVLIDENDNDEEEETVKMVISQNSEDNPVDYFPPRSIEPPSTPSVQPSSSKVETKSHGDKYLRLSKENLAKHTREQDEFYLMDILKKVQKTFPKKISEHPQNICAQAPNVFSCNEYEPKIKKLKKYHQILCEKNQNSSVSSAELAAQYDLELNVGPYSGTINEIDFDNPQNYHESFNKKLQADLVLSKQIKPSDKLREDHRHSQDSRMDIPSRNATKCSGKDKESSVNSSQPSSNNKNDDLIGFWRKCIRQGSTIVKRIKECDNIIKIINSNNQKKSIIEQNIQNQENVQTSKDPNVTNMDKIHSDVLTQKLNNETNVLKLTKQLKKRLYITASLLGINTDIGFDDISIDSEKSEIVESLIKKIIAELLNSNNSTNLVQYYSRMGGQSPKHLDTSCIELLTNVYEDLKQKFLSQFDRFSKDSKMIFNSSSSAALLSTTSNNDDEMSSFNRNQVATSCKSKSPNDFEISSHNTNEFDDSSTYLYDSPTSSLESTDMPSVSNAKKLHRPVSNRQAKSCKSKLSSEAGPRPRSNQDESGFDDGLICKIMQNYIDLFKTKESTCHPVLESKCCVKSTKTSTDESSKIIVENSSNDTFSYESKSNKAKTPEFKNDEDECVKNLNLNIYNDCFKCLSKVSTLDNQKNGVNESESD